MVGCDGMGWLSLDGSIYRAPTVLIIVRPHLFVETNTNTIILQRFVFLFTFYFRSESEPLKKLLGQQLNRQLDGGPRYVLNVYMVVPRMWVPIPKTQVICLNCECKKTRFFCNFWCPSEKIQVAANGTILTPEALPIAHLKAYVPIFSKHTCESW